MLKRGKFVVRACLEALVLGVIAAALPASAQEGPVYHTISSVGIDGPVYFRNAYAFTDERGGEGASAALIAFEGKVYALTAKHLLTDAMGIEPAVKPSEFDKALDFWVLVDNPGLYDPDSAETIISATGIFRTSDDWDDDVMLLKTSVTIDEASEFLLPVAKTLPPSGAGVVLIGCPYSQAGACGQNIYAGKVVQVSDGSMTLKLDNPPDRLAGFSGAPIIDRNGAIVAVLYGGSGDMVRASLLPDWLRK